MSVESKSGIAEAFLIPTDSLRPDIVGGGKQPPRIGVSIGGEHGEEEDIPRTGLFHIIDAEARAEEKDPTRNMLSRVIDSVIEKYALGINPDEGVSDRSLRIFTRKAIDAGLVKKRNGLNLREYISAILP